MPETRPGPAGSGLTPRTDRHAAVPASPHRTGGAVHRPGHLESPPQVADGDRAVDGGARLLPERNSREA